ncbi:MAG: SDR family oxidoreductase [Undibacterium sp.]|nr:SDR family oxidoreductase [Opitutaceae bacterium]
MRILLTGASGLVGAAFSRAAARHGHAVTGIVGGFAGELPGLLARRTIDLGDEAAITAVVVEVLPDAIVNCAAVSEPALVEQDPARSQAPNVALPTTLARLAKKMKARFVHISSEQAFDGARNAPYAVDGATSPINLYGRQKVASEQAVYHAAAEFAATVRAPLLMGNSPGGRRSTHERMFADWAAGKTAQLFSDEFRQPCTADNLAEVLLELCERRELCGVLHWAGAELISRHALGLALREHFKLSPRRAPITAVTRLEKPEVARTRQAHLALDLAPLVNVLNTRPQTLAQQLAGLRVPPSSRDWYFAA